MLQTFSCNGYKDAELQSQMYSFLTSIGSRSLVDSQYTILKLLNNFFQQLIRSMGGVVRAADTWFCIDLL